MTAPARAASARPARRPLLRWGLAGIVAAGGVLGTAAREGLTLVLPHWRFPVAVYAANVLGAFLLGFLIEALTRRGPDAGLRRLLRLGLGTGALGGFTTYSTLALGVAGVAGMAASRPPLDVTDPALAVSAAGYGLGTVVAGALAAFLGILAGTLVHARRAERGGTAPGGMVPDDTAPDDKVPAAAAPAATAAGDTVPGDTVFGDPVFGDPVPGDPASEHTGQEAR